MLTIINTGLSFGNLTSRQSTKRIIIHHSASPDVPASVIHEWHIGRGWSGIGYHFVIRQNGDIEEGRPLEMIGAHAGSPGNTDSIGICLTGNFMGNQPYNHQMVALVNLVKYLRELYQSELEVLRHKDVAPTLCPGELFPWPDSNWPSIVSEIPESWKKEVVDEALAKQLINEKHNPDDPAEKWFVLAVGLNILKQFDLYTPKTYT